MSLGAFVRALLTAWCHMRLVSHPEISLDKLFLLLYLYAFITVIVVIFIILG